MNSIKDATIKCIDLYREQIALERQLFKLKYDRGQAEKELWEKVMENPESLLPGAMNIAFGNVLISFDEDVGANRPATYTEILNTAELL